MRRLLSLCLIVCLVFCLLPAMSAASASGSGVCFIATNDNLLELTYQPYWQNSTIYVPYTVFVNFKVYNSFHQSSNTASLYSSTKQLYFDLNTGETYDGNGTYYNITPVSRGGQIYVPLDFICGQYGLTWSYIDGGEYGDVCRIKDGSVFLTDDQFLTAAKPLMVSRYNAYVGNSGGNWGGGGGGGTASDSGSIVYLSFVGLPSSALLDSLVEYGVRAAFFLTADEIRQSPDTVRRIVGEGHSVGALCSADPSAEYAEISSLLLDAARVKTVLIASAAPEYDESCIHVAVSTAWCSGTTTRTASRTAQASPTPRSHRLPRVPPRAARRAHPLLRRDRRLPPLRAQLHKRQRLHRPRPLRGQRPGTRMIRRTL